MKYSYKFAMLDREADYVDRCHLTLSDTKLQYTVHSEMDGIQIVTQMLNSVVCMIILKMPSDLHKLVCHTDREIQCKELEVKKKISFYPLLPDILDSKTYPSTMGKCISRNLDLGILLG